MLKKWECLPDWLKNDDVLYYYQRLKKKKCQLVMKRVFDLIVGICIAILLLPVMTVIAVMIKLDSKGPVLFRQERVTAYGKHFRICKFRTMVTDAESLGAQVTSKEDSRITGMGKILRKARLDELPQIFNVISGSMSFVGTRPEVPVYVDSYTDKMKATLLLPAGITSQASIFYKNEDALLTDPEDADTVYINEILPQKMKYNLSYLENYSFVYDFIIMFSTLAAVLGKDNAAVENEEKELTHI